jgi:hypothetical protein
MELRYDSKNDSRSELRLQLKMRMTFVIPTSTQLERSVSSQYYRTMYSPNHSSDSYDGCIENISSEQTTSTIRESLRGQEPSVMYKLYQVLVLRTLMAGFILDLHVIATRTFCTLKI